jgi:hypothetical protein
MEFIFHELQLNRVAESGLDPLQVAHRMLKDYTRALYIDMNIGDAENLKRKAQGIADEFHLRLEKTTGSLAALKDTFDRALRESV